MRKLAASGLASALLFFGLTLPATAQDNGPAFVTVEVFEIEPGGSATFESAAKKIVEAAKLAELAPEYGWSIYTKDNEYHIVSWQESLGVMDDPQYWVKQFMGTPGQERLMEGFAEFGSLDASGASSVARVVPEWTYTPENTTVTPGEHAGVMVFTDWVKLSQEEAFDENTKALIGLLKEMNFPYPVIGHQVVVGDVGACLFVVVHDGLEHFYGDKSIGNFIEAANLGEQWGSLMQARSAMMRDVESSPLTYRPDLSYRP